MTEELLGLAGMGLVAGFAMGAFFSFWFYETHLGVKEAEWLLAKAKARQQCREIMKSASKAAE